jgi:hypothetical protein
LRNDDALALDLLLGQIERIDEQCHERLVPVLLGGCDPVEALVMVRKRVGHDLVEAVLLRLEVVVERGRADADRRRDVRPLRLLVAVPPEVVRGDVEDLLSLDAGLQPRRSPLAGGP